MAAVDKTMSTCAMPACRSCSPMSAVWSTTRSAPIVRHQSRDSGREAVLTTNAEVLTLSSCVVSDPTPPAPPTIRTVSTPGGRADWSRKTASQPVSAPIGSDAASTNLSWSPILATSRWSTATRCAQHPSRVGSPVPITRSPTSKSCTALPVWTTTPANSQPRMTRPPGSALRVERIAASPGFTPIAQTSTSTSPSRSRGSSTSTRSTANASRVWAC